MGILKRIRDNNYKVGVRFYNNMRTGFSVAGPFFVVGGIISLCGYDVVYDCKGKTEIDCIIHSIVAIGLGVLFCYWRITVFSEKRYYKKHNKFNTPDR